MAFLTVFDNSSDPFTLFAVLCKSSSNRYQAVSDLALLVIPLKCLVASFTPQKLLLQREWVKLFQNEFVFYAFFVVWRLVTTSARATIFFNRNQSHPWYLELDRKVSKASRSSWREVCLNIVYHQREIAIQIKVDIAKESERKANSELTKPTRRRISCFDELHYSALLFVPRSIWSSW